MTPIEVLKAKARTIPTEWITDYVVLFAWDTTSEAERMTRAALIDVYIEREGAEAGDKLMNQIGL